MAYPDKLWKEAKLRCRLNEDDIRIAKEMGLNPKSLIKNIPSKQQQWKLPVKEWLRDMWDDRQEKAAKKRLKKLAALEQSEDNVTGVL
ncbi:MAG TPA: hypothetical protein VJ869_07935 [Sphaerochaeta sp.]|nr:hypothetical protein [Sphaerochaeta sp.]